MKPILKIYDAQGNEIPIPAIKGPPGADAIVDQVYSSTSKNAQSGIAVAEAISDAVGDISSALDSIIAYQESYIAQSPIPVSEEVGE